MTFDIGLWRDRFWSEAALCISEEGVSSISFQESAEKEEENLSGYILVKTSGSTGHAKWVVHCKQALLKHASMVNKHLGVTDKDRFGLVIPTYHVGGLGVIARALVSGAELVSLDLPWSAKTCVDWISHHKVSILSIVPTQLVDIVATGQTAPISLRFLIVGGGRLDHSIKKKAVMLGWPVFECYGMTETGSQIATGGVRNDGHLQLIDGWNVRLNEAGLLEVKGDCLFKGYAFGNPSDFKWIDPKVDGWFTTSDLVDIVEAGGEIGLKFMGRRDQMIKILGELVDVSLLEQMLAEHIDHEVYIIPLEDERRGMKLYPVTDQAAMLDEIRDVAWRGLHRLEEPVLVRVYPKNEMGKLQRFKLREIVETLVISVN